MFSQDGNVWRPSCVLMTSPQSCVVIPKHCHLPRSQCPKQRAEIVRTLNWNFNGKTAFTIIYSFYRTKLLQKGFPNNLIHFTAVCHTVSIISIYHTASLCSNFNQFYFIDEIRKFWHTLYNGGLWKVRFSPGQYTKKWLWYFKIFQHTGDLYHMSYRKSVNLS